MKKRIIAIIAAAALIITSAVTFSGCGAKEKIKIAIPNDTTNEARALLLLEELGYIKLKDNAGITATPKDIKDNPHNIEFKEVEAAQVPNVRQDVDYAIINSNYAIEAKFNPVKDSLGIEGSASAYGNILAVKEGNEKEPKILALKAALESQDVVDFINKQLPGCEASMPQGTYMVFMDCTGYCRKTGRTLDDVLKAGWNVGVAYQDGRAFLGENSIRINCALPLSREKEAFERLKKYVFVQ